MFGLFRKRSASAPPPASAREEPPPPWLDGPRPPTDADYAGALGLAPEALGAGPAVLSEEEARLASAVLEHFDANRPGPASFPGIALEVLELVRDPEVDAAQLARTVENDPALSAGILVLASSPVYRGLSGVRTVREAVARLGLAEVAKVAAALATRSLYRPEVRGDFEMFGAVWNRLFYHSAVVARAASDSARVHRTADPDRVFLAGMLHDVGKSIALRSLAALVRAGKVEVFDGAAIDRVLHDVHGVVGAEAHEEWRLPTHVAEVAARHHAPGLPAGPEHAGLHLVRLVSALRILRADPALHPEAPREIVESARALDLAPDRLAALDAQMGEFEEWVRMLFGDAAGGPATAG